MNLNNRTSITLIELLIAVLIFSLVIVSVISVDLAWRSYSQRSSSLDTLSNDANQAMEHIVKNLSQATGSYAQPAICTSGKNCPSPPSDIVNASSIYIRQNATLWVRYYLKTTDHGIYYDYDVDDSNLAESITRGDISGLSFSVSAATPNLVNISITARQNPAVTQDPVKNPQTQLRTTVTMSAVSGSP